MLSPRIHHFEVVDSTNDVALELARRGEPEGTVVTAGRQLQGRGRRGRVWWDEPGQSVLISAILTPGKPLQDLPQVTFVASLAVAECLCAAYGLDVLLKWPNDVLSGGKKIAGILVELAFLRTGTAAVVGIGLNVNQMRFPPDLADTATSVALETGRCWDVEESSLDLVDALFTEYENYQHRGFEEILRRWRKYMWGCGGHSEVISGGRTLEGTMVGVDSTGALILRDANGEQHVIHAADAISVEDR